MLLLDTWPKVPDQPVSFQGLVNPRPLDKDYLVVYQVMTMT